MTDPNRSQNELPALMEERRKYEGWLAALDAKRETTPGHVFDRVRADYESRLQRVQERLAAHRHAIEEERTSLMSRRALVDAEEQLRRDERAELDLRVHVGELSGSEADTAFRAVDEALEKLTSEKDGLSRRIGELDRLLDGKPASAEAAAEARTPTPAEVQAAAEETEHFVETSIAEMTQDASKAPTPITNPAVAAPRDALHTPGGSFDELAFLNDVVGEKGAEEGSEKPEPDAIVKQDDEEAGSLLGHLRDPGRRTSTETPLAANVPANTPIVLRSSGAIEQSKTLKCSECGAMNYPTEWYCERCGAELAAL